MESIPILSLKRNPTIGNNPLFDRVVLIREKQKLMALNPKLVHK